MPGIAETVKSDLENLVKLKLFKIFVLLFLNLFLIFLYIFSFEIIKIFGLYFFICLLITAAFLFAAKR